MICKDGKWERAIQSTAPACSRLRIDTHGPVTLEGGVSKDLFYTVKVTVNARSEAEAQRLLRQYSVRLESQGAWTILTAPGGAITTAVTVKAPRLAAAAVSTAEGAVQAAGIAGPLDVDTGAGPIAVDRVDGDCKLLTGGGDIDVGRIGGGLRSSTGVGYVTVGSVRGDAVLSTNGGDIVARETGGMVHAQTGGGGVHIGAAGGPVTVVSGGGEIVVEKAGGAVTLRDMAGPVEVGSAAGVRCDSAAGGIRLAHVAGPIRVATSMGSIMANLLGGRIADSYLATGYGDITVLIPSNVGVTIQARNRLADTLRRITSDFAAVQPRRQGMSVVAEGAVNGGGPLLQISGMGGTIFIKRQ